jgi:uncharacterized protein involved in exopolysaccharide biosynthesis
MSITGETAVLTPAEAAQRDLARLEFEKRRLLALYTAQHPDVRKKDEEIQSQRELIAALNVKTAGDAPPRSPAQASQPAAPEPATETAATAQLRSQLESTRLEIEDLLRNEQKLKADIDRYQARLNLTPVREQQLTAILRDYELTRQHYADLLRKESESQLASSLEKQQEGQQFRMVDPPNLPTRPSSPNREKFGLIGAAAGLVIGLALAVLTEARDSAFHNEKDLGARIAVPLIVGIPALMTPPERRVRRWKLLGQWCAAAVLICAAGIAELYIFRPW